MPTAKRPNSTAKPAKSKIALVEPSNRSVAEIEGAIRARAYELYEQRGREDGHAEEDWLRAEQEVRDQFGNRRSA